MFLPPPPTIRHCLEFLVHTHVDATQSTFWRRVCDPHACPIVRQSCLDPEVMTRPVRSILRYVGTYTREHDNLYFLGAGWPLCGRYIHVHSSSTSQHVVQINVDLTGDVPGGATPLVYSTFKSEEDKKQYYRISKTSTKYLFRQAS